MICPLWFYPVTKEQMHVSKIWDSFSRTCQEANVMYIFLFRSFLRDWSWIYADIYLHKKRLNYALSYDFEIFKGMSHNLELSSFQKMLVFKGL